MGCNHNNIKDLLKKFWQGQTSLEEENDIKAFFQFNDVSEELAEDKAYFELLREKDEDFLGSDFDDMILNKIDSNAGGIVRSMNYRSLYKIAATILVVIGVSALTWFMREDEKQIAEAQKQEEVQKAFEETKEALFLMSSKLNKGGNHTMMLGKFNDAEKVIKNRE